MKQFSIFISLFLFIYTNVRAQEDQDSIKTYDLNEVIVTATKTRVTRNNVPLTVSVIDRIEIEESSESALLPVLSEQIPGLFVTERGVTGFGVSDGSAGRISLRGVGGDPNTQVLVLLNGNPQYMGIFGHPMADAYIASDVERVEVIRGPASVLYGSNAMGGVINIITKEQIKDGFKGNARAMYGSYNTQKYMANGGFKKGRFNVFAGVNHDRTDGHRDSSDFSITNGYIRAGLKFNEHFNSTLDFSLAQFEATDPGMDTSVTEEVKAGEAIDIFRGMGAFVLNNQFDRFNGSARFFYNFGIHEITDGFRSQDNNYGLVVYEAMNFFKGNTITLGADLKNYGGFAENIKAMNGAGMVFTDTTVYEAAGYVLVQQEFFEKLTLNGGFRMEYNEMFGAEPVPSAGFAYRALRNTVIKGSVSKGFRSPTIRELFMFRPANADLQPEKMINYEATISQQFLKNSLSLELTVFKAKGENLIKILPEGGQPKNVNTGEFDNSGIEVAANYHLNRDLSFNANYSFISMDDPVIATPEHKAYISGTYKFDNFTFNLSLQGIYDLYLTTGDDPIKESYTLLNSRIGYKINKSIDIFIKGENLFNKDYQVNYGYPMPGIIIFGGLNLHL